MNIPLQSASWKSICGIFSPQQNKTIVEWRERKGKTAENRWKIVDEATRDQFQQTNPVEGGTGK